MSNEAFNIFALGDTRYRRVNIVGAVSLGILDLLIRLFELNPDPDAYNIHLILHYFIMLALVGILSSKEKIDDERSRQIRYNTFKITLSLGVTLGGIIVYFKGMIADDTLLISPLHIIYFIESILLLAIAFLWYGLRFNPSWLFREPTSPKRVAGLMLTAYIIIFVLTVFMILFPVLIDQ